MSSKLIHSEKPFFSNMVVDAVQCLDQDELDESLVGVKKIAGGGMQDSLLIKGVSFKKTFTYAGAEQQPKSFRDPLIVCLNVELELKAEKDNAEVRVEAVSDYQAIVDAEWEIIYRKLEAIENTGAKVVLSKLPIGDLADPVLCRSRYILRWTCCSGRSSPSSAGGGRFHPVNLFRHYTGTPWHMRAF